MKDSILSGPVLKRPNWDQPFYVKTDWSSFAKGGALCQPECTPEAEESLQKEREEVSTAEFDRTISGLRLRPVQFLSKGNTLAERSHPSSVGKLATGRWAFLKWRKYLSMVQTIFVDYGLQQHHQVLVNGSDAYSPRPTLEG